MNTDNQELGMFNSTEGKFTYDFIEELHMIVGVDAVTEFYKALMKHEPERVEEFKAALKDFYELKRIMD